MLNLVRAPLVEKKLKHFYIAEDQSVYLLNHEDATKFKEWVKLCQQQLSLLGYHNIAMVGKGAYGFVFSGDDDENNAYVFKFSRINLPPHVQDRLAEEAEIQDELNHSRIPQVYEYYKIKRQNILHMQRAPGIDLEKLSHQRGPLAPELIVNIAIQLAEILRYLRDSKQHKKGKPYVHGDIKPSNIVYNEELQKIYLVDWGSAVVAQLDTHGQTTANNVMDLMSSDLQNTNARLGDVYFIGPEQINGCMSSPRFDEQGFAATIYALASGQSCRYGAKVITPLSLGLPKLLAQILDGMLSDDKKIRDKAGDYLFKHLKLLKQTVLSSQPTWPEIKPLIPVWAKPIAGEIDTVVYGSRKSFLRELDSDDELNKIDDVQLEKYYKNYLMGMGDVEKAFIAAVGRLGSFPVVGGIAIRWEKNGVYIDSSLRLFDESLKVSFQSAVNNMVNLAQGIFRVGVFKSCLFNARNTLHVERNCEQEPFVAAEGQKINFDISDVAEVDDITRLHSYFEDGKDPDEYLYLPEPIMAVLAKLNQIHHTGCIIFEVLPTHLKIHSYLRLLNHDKAQEFSEHLAEIITLLPTIEGLGISGFMKLPYKDTRFFELINQLPERYYPKNPKI
ncbi:protein kinase domain-containing protein [Thalassotalea piscium]|uniref:Non-specific serine/threonine protein kinase n=1 Tax=Thalassotalea piscium TaxID=1230533 RepID=A0A7X0NIF9_9GAMM|nr:protein kinase [Thalassotalea piscium]MBB6544053.1 non-specific serine/threonine protein kinase [Thalassotalea piscium]